jgi:hypothetical protein
MRSLILAKLIIFFLLLSVILVANPLKANDTLDYSNLERGSYKRISIMPSGIHYEILANKNNSLILSAQIIQSPGLAFANLQIISYYSITPAFNIAYRYYYNMNKRIRKKKIVDFRSLSFFGILLANQGSVYDIVDLHRRNAFKKEMLNKNFFKRKVSYIGPTWGFQRCLGKKKHLYWSMEFGIGYKVFRLNEPKGSVKYDDWSLIGDFFTFGYVL